MRITVFEPSGQREVQTLELGDHLASGTFLWVDMTGPTDEDIQVMQEVFGFHPLAIKQTHNEKQRPKLEEYGDYMFLIINPVTPGAERLAFRELNLFVAWLH